MLGAADDGFILDSDSCLMDACGRMWTQVERESGGLEDAQAFGRAGRRGKGGWLGPGKGGTGSKLLACGVGVSRFCLRLLSAAWPRHPQPARGTPASLLSALAAVSLALRVAPSRLGRGIGAPSGNSTESNQLCPTREASAWLSSCTPAGPKAPSKRESKLQDLLGP